MWTFTALEFFLLSSYIYRFVFCKCSSWAQKFYAHWYKHLQPLPQRTWVSLLKNMVKEEPEVFGKAVYSPLFWMEKGRENGDISVPSVWFFSADHSALQWLGFLFLLETFWAWKHHSRCFLWHLNIDLSLPGNIPI